MVVSELGQRGDPVNIGVLEGKPPIWNSRWQDMVRGVVKFVLSIGTGLPLALQLVAICREPASVVISLPQTRVGLTRGIALTSDFTLGGCGHG